MAIINMHDAKTQLSDLVARAEAGEEIVIARRNLPAVKLVPVGVVPVGVVAVTGFEEEGQMGLSGAEDLQSKTGAAPRIRGFGLLAHLPSPPPDIFFEPLSDDELDAWEGKYSMPFEGGPS
jgi:prevent-host-death family protein